jgi:mannose-1-phosphate guanylyltransferase/mannose-6-phosphate isomerase
MSVIRPAILCGGAGARLWPLSRARAPKQLHALVTDRTMVTETLVRMREAAGPEAGAPILIAAANTAGAIAAASAAAGEPEARIILEPVARNTAPAAVLAALAAQSDLAGSAGFADALVLLTPSDAHIGDVQAFRRAVDAGADLARAGYIVTFGVRPSEANTGYGYIQRGAPLGPGFRVARFTEKPEKRVAEAYIADGGYDWNAGIFLFRADLMLAEFARLAPEVFAAATAAWRAGRSEGPFTLPDAALWRAAPSISIDYAIAEKTDKAAVVPVDMAWSDVGSWSALWDIGAKDESGNVVAGDVVLADARNCLVRAQGRLVAVVGVEDLIVVETDDAVLVASRSRAQDVKLIVDSLKASGRVALTDGVDPDPAT